MRLGLETFDCPCTGDKDKTDTLLELALIWLNQQCEQLELAGRFEKYMNPHDFGSYPSFEFYPDEPDQWEELDGMSTIDFELYDNNWDKLNKLLKDYSEKYSDSL